MTIIVHFTIKHQVYYDWKFKEQHAKIWENIAGTKRYFRLRGFNIAGVSAPVAPSIPTPLDWSGVKITKLLQIKNLRFQVGSHNSLSFLAV